MNPSPPLADAPASPWPPMDNPNNCTPAERRFLERVYELDELFEDMLFRPGSATCFLIRVQCLDSKSGKWMDDIMTLPFPLESFSLTDFRFKVFQPGDREDGVLGYFNPEKRELGVLAGEVESDCTILHELIHLHEAVFEDDHVPRFFRDMLFWGLYQQARKRIPRLDDLVSGHAYLLTQRILYDNGGDHDILFLLKSFDLDMRMGYPLGTVFAYGRAADFKDYSYVAEGDGPKAE